MVCSVVKSSSIAVYGLELDNVHCAKQQVHNISSSSSSKFIDNYLYTKIYKITFSTVDNIQTINKIICEEKHTFPYYYVMSINNKHNVVVFNVYNMNLKRDTNVHTH